MRVVVAEDSALLREGLARLLADEAHEVTAAVGDAEALLTAVAAAAPLPFPSARVPGARAACGVPRGPDRLRLDQTSTGT